jgi:hypothetical protein
MALNL